MSIGSINSHVSKTLIRRCNLETCVFFQLYSVYLEGFLFCKVRYSQLHQWNEQVRRSSSLRFFLLPLIVFPSHFQFLSENFLEDIYFIWKEHIW